jgi:hypothetical protein
VVGMGRIVAMEGVEMDAEDGLQTVKDLVRVSTPAREMRVVVGDSGAVMRAAASISVRRLALAILRLLATLPDDHPRVPLLHAALEKHTSSQEAPP